MGTPRMDLRGLAFEAGAFALRHFPIPRGRLRIQRALVRLNGKRLHRYSIRPGLQMDLDPRDLLQAFILFEGAYEQHVLTTLERLLPAGGYFVDVGANIGLHTLVASRRAGAGGRVDAIEPEPFSRERLEDHLTLNGCDNVRVFPFALSDRVGTAVLHLSPTENLAKSSFSQDNVTLGLSEKSPGSLEVKVMPLDEHVATAGRVPDLVKIDVEGAELLVVSGGLRTLARPDAPALMFEASDLQAAPFGYTTQTLKAKLAELGYQIFRYRGERLEKVTTAEGHRLEDLLALRQSHFPKLFES